MPKVYSVMCNPGKTAGGFPNPLVQMDTKFGQVTPMPWQK